MKGFVRIHFNKGAKYLRLLWTGILTQWFCVLAYSQVTDGYNGPLPDSSIVVLPDSSNFVRASLLIVDPANSFYSVFGHAALRMQCPAYHLDYVFTFESDPDVSGFVRFFMGKARARYVSVPSQLFIDQISNEERRLMQYELNLTHHQKQNLWRVLDESVAEGDRWRFSLRNNCVSMLERNVEIAATGDSIRWQRHPDEVMRNNGEELRYDLRRSPWAEFVFVTFGGSACDEQYDFVSRLTPENLPEALQHALFVNIETGTQRTMLTGDAEQIFAATSPLLPSPFTPTKAFFLLLAICLIVTLFEWILNWKWIACCFDHILFLVQTLFGLLLLVVTLGSDVFHLQWNWYLIPINPLPFLIWLIWRKRKHFGRVYLFYALMLVAFLAITPMIEQLDLPHQFVTTMFTIRCLSNYFSYFKEKL